MAGVSDFLTEGAAIPAGSALTAVSGQTILPDWYTNAAMQTLANQQALSAQAYQPYQGPRVAAFTPAQQQGFGMTQQAAGAYQPALSAATAGTQAAMAQPGGVTAAQPYFSQAGGMSGVTAAQPYMAAASGNTANVGEYMNPYTSDIVNRIGELGGRNLSENLLPALTSKYISAGQLGFGPRGGSVAPSGMMTDTARALRDVNADILAQQSAALQSGYTQAQQAKAADLARQANLATTAGSLTQAQQRTLADIGTNVGNLTGADISRSLTGAGQLGELAGLAQQYGLTGANAVTGVGAQQQAQGQKNLDVAYSDFLAQKGYNQEQINSMLATLKGISPMVPTASQEVGIKPTGQAATYKPSTAATIAGALSAGAGILDTVGVFG